MSLQPVARPLRGYSTDEQTSVNQSQPPAPTLVPPNTPESNISRAHQSANSVPPTPERPPLQMQPKNRANISIATQNMNGLMAPTSNMNFLEKWATINTNLNQNKLAILALQETHLDQETVNRLRQIYKDKMEIIFSADPNSPRATAGIAFVINKKCLNLKDWTAHELIPGCALFLRIKWHESEYTSFLNVYAPTHKVSL
jgi:hypothetical protein